MAVTGVLPGVNQSIVEAQVLRLNNGLPYLEHLNRRLVNNLGVRDAELARISPKTTTTTQKII